jgi:MOSC domain-containing protein YiiM
MVHTSHRSYSELEAELDLIRAAPREEGRLELIVRRPGRDEREILSSGALSLELGLVGDRWRERAHGKEDQLTLISTRVLAALEPKRERWPLAGDQLYVDFDLGSANVPPGTRLAIGAAVVEASAMPHTGCKKFRERFGVDAWRFIGSEIGTTLQMRGINASVIEPGEVRVGDAVRKLAR